LTEGVLVAVGGDSFFAVSIVGLAVVAKTGSLTVLGGLIAGFELLNGASFTVAVVVLVALALFVFSLPTEAVGVAVFTGTRH
jgi:hypothetical protein